MVKETRNGNDYVVLTIRLSCRRHPDIVKLLEQFKEPETFVKTLLKWYNENNKTTH